MAEISDKEVQTANNQWSRYSRARDSGHLDYIEIAKKCDAYYRGEQWDEMDKQKLDAEGRPALTINTILSTINTILGHQASQEADVVFKPRKSTDQGLADTMTKVYKQIMDNNDFQFIESQMFSDGLIQDRGYFDIRIDFDDNVNGEIRLSVEDPIDILPDPDAKSYDPKDWQEFFKTRWLSLDEISEMYGEKKAKSVEYYAKSGQSYGRDSISYEDYTEGFGDTDLSNYRSDYIGKGEVESVRSVRVIERQHRKLVKQDFFMRASSGDMRPVPAHFDKDQTRQFADENGYMITSKNVRRVRYTVTADRVVLHDDWSPYHDLTIVPFFPYFRRGKPFGMVRNLLSPQEQLNKLASQELHIVNTTANSGWIIEQGSLSNLDEDELAERGSETGLIMVHNRGSTPPSKIPPNSIPTGLDKIAQKSQSNIKEISGVTDALLGSASPEVSGVALERNKAAGQVQIQIPMEHLRFTRQILARKVVSLIQSFYTDERILQITDESDPLKPRNELVVNQIDPQTGRIINDLTIGEYDITVGTAPARDTFDEIQFAQALSLRQAGVMIPDDLIVEYSHLHKKGALAKTIRQITGREKTPEQQQLVQMQQQLAMQAAQFEVMKLESEIMKLRADTELAMAKARSEGVVPEIELQKLESDLRSRMVELDARLEMSKMSHDNSSEIAQLREGTKLATEIMKVKELKSNIKESGRKINGTG